MTLIEKLDILKAKKGDTNASLARNSGIAYTTIDGLYKKGYQNMKLSTLQSLCDYFDVPIDYLARDDEGEDMAATADELSMMEVSRLFLSLTNENQKKLLDYAQLLLGSQQAGNGSQE